MAITPDDLAARCARLEQLLVGFMREYHRLPEDAPLLYVERRAYLGALGAAARACEDARVVLARARRRIGRDEGTGGR